MPSELYYPYGASSLTINIYKSNSIASSAVNTVWTPASGKRIILFGFWLEQVGASTANTQLFLGTSTQFWNGFVAQNANVNYTFEKGLDIFAIDQVMSMKTNSGVSSMNYSFYGTEV